MNERVSFWNKRVRIESMRQSFQRSCSGPGGPSGRLKCPQTRAGRGVEDFLLLLSSLIWPNKVQPELEAATVLLQWIVGLFAATLPALSHNLCGKSGHDVVCFPAFPYRPKPFLSCCQTEGHILGRCQTGKRHKWSVSALVLNSCSCLDKKLLFLNAITI